MGDIKEQADGKSPYLGSIYKDPKHHRFRYWMFARTIWQYSCILNSYTYSKSPRNPKCVWLLMCNGLFHFILNIMHIAIPKSVEPTCALWGSSVPFHTECMWQAFVKSKACCRHSKSEIIPKKAINSLSADST